MSETIKQSKRGGPRKGAGRPAKKTRIQELKRAGVLTHEPSEQEKSEPVKLGRPHGLTDEMVVQAEKLCRLGATDLELADFFEVDIRTIYRWAQAREAFCHALKSGKEAADERVERSLYNRAVGYTHDAVKIFMPAGAESPIYAPYREHVPPDVTAASKWLNNRRPAAWRERQEHIHKFKSEQMTDDDLAAIAAGSGSGAAEAPPHPGKPH